MHKLIHHFPKDELLEKQNNLLAMITHDLKSPMIAILGAVELLQDMPTQGLKPDLLTESLQLISSAGQNMMELIDQILIMARIEAGKEPIDPIRIDQLDLVLNSISETFKYEAKINSITITNNIAPQLPDVYWDLHKIQYHVLNNIFSNALKFTPAGGRIELSAGVDGGHIVIKIADNGPGISEIDRKRIFNRYERILVESKRSYKSAGLGLYNAHLFVHKHNGTITVSDGLDGCGSCFTIKLPPQPFNTAVASPYYL